MGLFWFFASIVFWIWGLVIPYKYWNVIPLWAKILAVLGLLSGGGGLFTVIIVYIGWAVNRKIY